MTKTKREKKRQQDYKTQGFTFCTTEEILTVKKNAWAKARKIWYRALVQDMPLRRPYAIGQEAVVELVKVRPGKRRQKTEAKFIIKTVDLLKRELTLVAVTKSDYVQAKRKRDFYDSHGFKIDDIMSLTKTLTTYIIPRVKALLAVKDKQIPTDIQGVCSSEAEATAVWNQYLQTVYQGLCLSVTNHEEGRQLRLELGRQRASDLKDTGAKLFHKYFTAIWEQICKTISTVGSLDAVDRVNEKSHLLGLMEGSCVSSKTKTRKARLRLSRSDVLVKPEDATVGDCLEFRLVRPRKRKERIIFPWTFTYTDPYTEYLILEPKANALVVSRKKQNENCCSGSSPHCGAERPCTVLEFLLPRLEAYIGLGWLSLPEQIEERYPGDRDSAITVWRQILQEMYLGLCLAADNDKGCAIRKEVGEEAAQLLQQKGLQFLRHYFFDLWADDEPM